MLLRHRKGILVLDKAPVVRVLQVVAGVDLRQLRMMRDVQHRLVLVQHAHVGLQRVTDL